MSGGKSDLYVSSPSSSDQSQLPKPLSPFPGGAGEFLPSTLNGRGLKWVGQGPAGVGGFLLCPIPTPSCPPILYPPLETEDLLFSIIYMSDLGPLFFLPH